MAAILCQPCTAACRLCDDGIAGLCTKTLAGFVLVTAATQLPLAVVAALGLPRLFDGCRGAQWLLGMFLAALAHLVAGAYVAGRVNDRIAYLLCHDPWIALYLLVVGFFVTWMIVGSLWSLGGGNDGDGSLDEGGDSGADPGCDAALDDRVALSLGLGWTHFFLAPTVLSCALCCGCCDGTDYAADAAEFAAKAAEEEARKQKKKDQEKSDGGDVEAPPPSAPTKDGKAETQGRGAAAGLTVGIPVAHTDGNVAVVDAVVEEPLPLPVPPPTAPPDEKVRVY